MRIDRTSRLVFAIDIRFCPFANLLPGSYCSVGSPGRTEPTTGYSRAGSKTLACCRLITTGNSVKSG